MRKNRFTILGVILAVCFLWQSCAKEKSGTPAWLEIDSLELDPANTQLTKSHNFTDAWVYVNSNLVGAFELPARIPILAEGNANVIIFPGIQVNGLTALRAQYLKTVAFQQNMNFVPGQTNHLNYTFKFDTLVVKVINEKFEGGISQFQKSAGAYGEYTTVNSSQSFEGGWMGLIRHNGQESTIAQIENTTWMQFPKGDVGGLFLEMNYKSNTSFTVSLLCRPSNGSADQKIGVIGISPTNGEWKKIYITLSPTVNDFTIGNQFKIAIGYSRQPDIPVQEVYLDNIQVIY